jgi:hypothetical protein
MWGPYARRLRMSRIYEQKTRFFAHDGRHMRTLCAYLDPYAQKYLYFAHMN